MFNAQMQLEEARWRRDPAEKADSLASCSKDSASGMIIGNTVPDMGITSDTIVQVKPDLR